MLEIKVVQLYLMCISVLYYISTNQDKSVMFQYPYNEINGLAWIILCLIFVLSVVSLQKYLNNSKL